MFCLANIHPSIIFIAVTKKLKPISACFKHERDARWAGRQSTAGGT